jgi:hypothetical protein
MARSRTVRRGGFSGFYAIVVVIVVVGTALVLFSRKANDAGAVGPYIAPHADSHWHAAVAANICGTWQPGPIWPSYTDSGTLARKGTNTYAGLHTHTLQNGQSDGLIHMEPATVDESGKFATVGLWLKYGGWKATDSSLSLWTGADGKPIKVKNGDVCPSGPYQGKKGTVFWALGRNQSGKTTKLVVQDGKSLSSYKLFDQDVIGIYFLPSGTKLNGDLGKVPSESNLVDPSAGEGAGHTNVGGPNAPTTTTPSSITTVKPGTTPTTKAQSKSTSSSTTPTTTTATTTGSTTATTKAP